MGVELEKNVRARVSKALLRRLDGHTSFLHLRGLPVTEKTPGDVRKIEFLRDRLNAPGEKVLMPDRSLASMLDRDPHATGHCRSEINGVPRFLSQRVIPANGIFVAARSTYDSLLVALRGVNMKK